MGSSLLNGDMLKIGMLMMVLGIIMMMVFSRVRKIIFKKRKQAIIYIVLTLIVFALTGLLSSRKIFNDVASNSFIGFQILFLLYGIINIIVMRKHFSNLTEDDKDYWSEFVFTLGILAIGLIGFIGVVSLYRPNFKFIFLGAAFWYVIPIFVYRMYEMAMRIPVPIYKKWVYPVNKVIKEPTGRELENPLVISFEFPKTNMDPDLTKFRVKAPVDMEFGKLFYFFILDYNERHPEEKIEYLDGQTMNPHQWIFYFKPKWWKSITHINHVKTIQGNAIKEDQVIVCERVFDTSSSED